LTLRLCSWYQAEQWINMFSSQCNHFSLICITLLFESFWTASNDICMSCIHWINSSALRSVLWDLLEVLCLRFQRRLMLCSLLLIWLFTSSHFLKCVNLMILSKIWMNLKCYWRLSIENMLYTLHATYIKHNFYADFLLRLERLLKEFSCDRFTVQDK